MSANHLLASLLVLFAMTGAARADAVLDFRTGTTVKLVTGDLGTGARVFTSSAPIDKRSGTLDFTIDASHLGVKLPIAIRMRGKAIGGGKIDYTVDEVYSPPIDLGAGHSLASLSGHVYLRASALPGTMKQDIGNVRLRIAGASSLVATSDLGKMTIPIAELQLIGGVPQPALAMFADTTRTWICSDKVPTDHALSLSLTAAARGNGATVELRQPPHAGVALPNAILVGLGRQTAIIPARVAPYFVGTVRLTAAAGGVTRTLDVVVHPPGDCAR